MATQSAIEWTESTWNPVTGCTKISAGCANCYAERMARRLQAMGQYRYRHGFEVTLQPEALDEPARWRRSRMVFVNSMSDLFHEAVPTAFIRRVFDVMKANRRHTFQIRTKRSARLRELAPSLDWPDNIWMGVTVEREDYRDRIADLRTIGCGVRFLSLEPLLGPMSQLDLAGVDWVIVGGESGPGARPMDAEWARGVRDRCVAMGIPFFFKQWGGVNKKRAGRVLDGRLWNQYPKPLERQLLAT
ncbi:MAG TPA: phage Gp37/Gp68 family protein [Phycisphaerales bacterium]|nr:phage Gp37/Gp68 family protein [Phycisphaerales bacterium]